MNIAKLLQEITYAAEETVIPMAEPAYKLLSKDLKGRPDISIIITGMHNIGKTSLLNYIKCGNAGRTVSTVGGDCFS